MNKIDLIPTMLVTKRRGTITLGPNTEQERGDTEIPIMFTMTFGAPDKTHEVVKDPDSAIVNLEGKLQIDFGQIARLEVRLEQISTIHQEPPREEHE